MNEITNKKTLEETLSECLLKFAKELNDNGFDVYTSKKKNPIYLYFVKDNNIGYVERSPFGYNFETVHKPNKLCGTHFSIARECVEPTIELAKMCFVVKPSWARKYKNPIKYKSWDDYLSHPINKILEYVKI